MNTRGEARRRVHELALAAQREEAVRIDPVARAEWLSRIPEMYQPVMAEYADRVYGRLRSCSRPGCSSRARWQIGSAHSSCDDHLAAVIAAAYRAAQPVYLPTWGIA